MVNKSRSIKRFHSHQSSCHEDRQTSGHVDDTLPQQASRSEAIGRLPTNGSEKCRTLPVHTSQDHQNGDYPEIISAATKTMIIDADTLHEDARRSQRRPESESSPSYQEGSTRIELLPRPISMDHDMKLLTVVPISTLAGAQQDLERNDPMVPIHESTMLDLTRDNLARDTAPETTGIPKFIEDPDDFLSPSHRREYIQRSILDAKGDSAPVLETSYSSEGVREQSSGQLNELTLEGQSHSQSTSEKEQLYLSSTLAPNQVELSLPNTHPELVREEKGSLLSIKLNGMERPEPTSSQEDYLEPNVETALKLESLDHHSHSVHAPEMPDQNVPFPISPPRSDSKHEMYSPQLFSLKQSDERLTSNTQSRSRSSKPQESWVVKGQERRRRREDRRHEYLARNLLSRSRAYKERTRLRRLRFEVNSADEAYMKLVRERRVKGNQDDLALEECYKRLQDARNEYGLHEDTYNKTEEQLDRDEFEAKELEEKFQAHGPDSASLSSSISEAESEAPVIPNHPLYDKYISKIWNAEIYHEKISDLDFEHENLLRSQKIRQRVGRELAQEDQLKLKNFSCTKAKLLDQLTQVEAEVEDLRLACIKEGLLDEYEYEADEDEEDVLQQPSARSMVAEEADYKKYHLLMENPGDKEDEKKSKVLLTDFIDDDVSDRITCWLLHKLRSSGLEVELLARYNDRLDRSADTEKWQEEVLNFWFIDSVNLESSAYVGNPSLTATSPVSPANLDRKHDSNSGNLYHMQLIVRSSVLSRNLEIAMRLKLGRINGRSVITE